MSIGVIVLIIVAVTVLSGLADAPRKRHHRKRSKISEDSLNNGCIGCSVIIGIALIIAIVMAVVDFVKAHTTEFAIAGILLAFVGFMVIVIRWGNDTGTTVPPPISPKNPLKNSTEKPEHNDAPPTRCAIPYSTNNQTTDFPSAAEIAGKEGEDKVSRAVWTACQFDGRHYKILRNVYVPKPNGTKTEIDVLLLHETGVYVFESKNLHGSIYGDIDHLRWQRFKDNGDKDFVPNPILQNEGHINALRAFLKQDKWQFRVFSLIVFGTKSKLKFIHEDSSLTTIHEVYNLEMDLVKKMASNQPFYSAETIDDWCRKLLPGTMLSDEEKQAHIERITQKFGRIRN